MPELNTSEIEVSEDFGGLHLLSGTSGMRESGGFGSHCLSWTPL